MNLSIIDGKIDYDPESDDEILTAVIISIFTDARLTEEEFEQVREWEKSRRGFWGDQLDGTLSGSKLWTLKRSPKDEETLEKAESYCEEALAWMKEDQMVESVDVSAAWEDDDLRLEITINKNEIYRLMYKR